MLGNKIKIYTREPEVKRDLDHQIYWGRNKIPCPWKSKFFECMWDNGRYMEPGSRPNQSQNDWYQNTIKGSSFGASSKYVVIQLFNDDEEIAVAVFAYVDKFDDLYHDGEIISHPELHWNLRELRYPKTATFGISPKSYKEANEEFENRFRELMKYLFKVRFHQQNAYGHNPYPHDRYGDHFICESLTIVPPAEPDTVSPAVISDEPIISTPNSFWMENLSIGPAKKHTLLDQYAIEFVNFKDHLLNYCSPEDDPEQLKRIYALVF